MNLAGAARRQTPKPAPERQVACRDRARVRAAIRHYEAWIGELEQVTGARDDIVHAMVAALNCYKTFIDLELVFDSPEDFLYRQKGQLKLDNTAVEEFMPWLVRTCLP